MDVSRLVLGTMYFGTRTDERTSVAIIDAFVAAGGRTLDTANCYAFWCSADGRGGDSERLLGRWLAADAGRRQLVEIATKVGQEPTGSGVEGLSAEVVLRECDRSLERLGVETVDVHWAHGEDRSISLAETVTAFGELVTSGRARRVGVSNHPTWRVERARRLAADAGVEPFTLLQLSTSYVEPRPGTTVEGKDHRFGFVTDETIDYLQEHPELELWAYSPLVQGAYDRADRPFPQVYDHPGTTQRLAVLRAVAERRGVAPSTIVLAWLLARRPQARPIVGVSTLEQLDAALAVADIDLEPEELARLDDPR
ncbi:aldo/keto reductase [Aeromicrobium sp. CTD01-1L150]|uniref:aldo/keto reductase n=1 Tax=Aeromicrobium sp. CTD01-1L150 TaxID=3341830 RepID=UPI0035BF6515